MDMLGWEDRLEETAAERHSKNKARFSSKLEMETVLPAASIDVAYRRMLALLKYPFYLLFILDNGKNLISKSLTVLTPA